MITPLAFADSLRIGNVDFVSPDEIKVLLDIEAPQDVALNTGVPRPFPRINNYVLLPNESGHLVAQIEWITVERSQYPKRKGMQDFGIIDLPFPLRKMSLTPLGVLRESGGKSSSYSFSRGVEVFPTVGDPVLLPLQEQLHAIVESGENRRVKIGTSPLASNADVLIDPDRLFGRHLAVLGNTGSGKSCTVAGVIRWCIESARAAKERTNAESEDLTGELSDEVREQYGLNSLINSRFIILDPNGEYSQAFRDLDNVRLYAVEGNDEKNIHQLQVPLWFWNSAEWCTFVQAGSGAQRPTLIQSLRAVRDGKMEVSLTPSTAMRRYIFGLISLLALDMSSGAPWAGGGKTKGFKDRIDNWEKGLIEDVSFTDGENTALVALKEALSTFRDGNQATGNNTKEWPLYAKPSADLLVVAFREAHSAFGGSDTDFLPIDADLPRPFIGEDLLKSVEANAELMGTTGYIEPMLMRIRTLLSDFRMRTITNCDTVLTLEQWLENYICPSESGKGAVTVIDLSLVPAEVIHIITAVISRIILEALQRYRQLNNGITLPTTLVMEEAHTFIRRYASEFEETSAHAMCTQVFEKIAREGRKFGLGLVLSSQRPSELSPTVLSQCNTFLLHRISNDRDQELVGKLVPDTFRGLLRDLPSLPSQRAILLGWASELPVLVQMNYLDEAHRPQSNDPNYWDVWTKRAAQKVSWKDVSQSWQEAGQVAAAEEASRGGEDAENNIAIDDEYDF